MPYVRKRGRQVAIVHGERDPGTKKVEQRILFTLYSKTEALAVLGKTSQGDARSFEHLVEREYPDLRFEWPKIRSGVEKNMEVLPDLYDYRQERLRGSFRRSLTGFAKSLLLADPQWQVSSAQLIAEHRHELEFLSELISWRLEHCDDQERGEFNGDNAFYWLHSLPGRGVPPESEELASELYQQGELDKAEAVFEMLVEAFEPYAEGHNYLGLIALDRKHYDRAVEHFEKTIELGRREFPKRLAKKHYWRDLRTRPYIRGLRNLALTFNYMGRFEDGLGVCDRLHDECGDEASADLTRAAIYMNLGMFQLAAPRARKWHQIWPSEALVAGLALIEQDETEEAVPLLLHGVLNHPRAARMLVGEPASFHPETSDEIGDHNEGVSLRQGLHRYLESESAGIDTLRELLSAPRVVELLDELELAHDRWHEDRAGFDALNELRSFQFAKRVGLELRLGK